MSNAVRLSMPATANLPGIEQVPNLPANVARFTSTYEVRLRATADNLVNTAIALEDRAAKLRTKAETIFKDLVLAQEVRDAVEFERKCHEEVVSLALVNVDNRREMDG